MRDREREKQALCREPDVGLDPGTPASRPEPKADSQPLTHAGVPNLWLFICLVLSGFVRIVSKLKVHRLSLKRDSKDMTFNA